MTAQALDTLEYRERRWLVRDAAGQPLFDPGQHGIVPMPTSTASVRGYWCGYGLRGGQLHLRRLSVWTWDAPLLNGVASHPADVPGVLRYDDVWLPVPFDGRLLVDAGGLLTRNLELRFSAGVFVGERKVWFERRLG